MWPKGLFFTRRTGFGAGVLFLVAAVACGIWSGRLVLALESEGTTLKTVCEPTSPDALGPFYKPDAPVRAKVGEGYVLKGVVRSARDCSAIPGATIEFWLAGPDGRYDDAHRATLPSDESGAYRFESYLPPRYGFRPPHIHIRASAPGHETLVTQHYPKDARSEDALDLVMVPR